MVISETLTEGPVAIIKPISVRYFPEVSRFGGAKALPVREEEELSINGTLTYAEVTTAKIGVSELLPLWLLSVVLKLAMILKPMFITILSSESEEFNLFRSNLADEFEVKSNPVMFISVAHSGCSVGNAMSNRNAPNALSYGFKSIVLERSTKRTSILGGRLTVSILCKKVRALKTFNDDDYNRLKWFALIGNATLDSCQTKRSHFFNLAKREGQTYLLRQIWVKTQRFPYLLKLAQHHSRE